MSKWWDRLMGKPVVPPPPTQESPKTKMLRRDYLARERRATAVIAEVRRLEQQLRRNGR